MRKLSTIVLLLLGFAPVVSAADMAETAGEVRPLLVGTQAPAPAGLLDEQSAAFDLGAAMAGKPTVLVFYRGHW